MEPEIGFSEVDGILSGYRRQFGNHTPAAFAQNEFLNFS
jgi:hypothetical protein